MQFGDIPTADAAGTILAHSVRLDDLVLKKGHCLSMGDIDGLMARGVTSITGARLSPDDLPEDDAASALAAPFLGSAVRADPPFTGRVNLFATQDGIFHVDAAVINAVNRIDPAITIATRSDLSRVQAGQILATVKIIPFSASKAAVEHCLELTGATPPIRVAPFVAKKILLIQTCLPHTPTKVLDKTVRVTGARAKAVGGRLVRETRTTHAVAPLSAEIAAVSGVDILLIAGASAITDIDDVLPQAVTRAHGRIIHFGMPVDPGNLLLLAELNGMHVIGLPGCARSPKLNGFDWVLERLAAGIDVAAKDIMAMGVGGLLSEIPSRPQPRERTSKQSKNCAAVILAAGQSRRMGDANKLLIEIEGKPMLCHMIDAALDAGAEPVILVTGHEHKRIEAATAGIPIKIVYNPDFAQGLSTSIRTGLQALGPDIDAALIAQGDMPKIGPGLLKRMIGSLDPGQGRAIVVPTFRGKRGNPVLWSRSFFDAMMTLSGDVGARHLIGEHDEVVFEVESDDDAPLLDLDTPGAVDMFQGCIR